MGAKAKKLIPKQCGNCKYYLDSRCNNQVSEWESRRRKQKDICTGFSAINELIEQWIKDN